MTPPHFLHLFGPEAFAGQSRRAAALIAAWGDRARHVVMLPEGGDAVRLRAAAGAARVEMAQNPPPLSGRPSVARYEAIARTMRGYDLVLTYGWGAIDGPMAARVFGRDAPPVVHHEDGLERDELRGGRRDRALYRRIALSAARALAVPDAGLAGVAARRWGQGGVHVIPPGIDGNRIAHRPDRRLVSGLPSVRGVPIIGAVGDLTSANDWPSLIRAAGGLAGPFHLVIAGEGPERHRIAGAAAAMGIGDRLSLPGNLGDPAVYLRLFDLLVLPDRPGDFADAGLCAMAAGLPITGVASLGLRDLVPPAAADRFAAAFDPILLRDAIEPLRADAARRKALGDANRCRATEAFAMAPFVTAYAALYEGAMDRLGILTG